MMRTKSRSRRQATLDVAVLGTPAMDLVARVHALPCVDGLAIAGEYRPCPGGAAANVAVGVARLGCRVGFLGALGDDDHGRTLLSAFEDEGIDTGGVQIERGKSSPSCFIAVGPQGERMIFALGGEALLDKAEELKTPLLRGVRALYVTDVPVHVAEAAMVAAREEGGVVFLSPGGLLSSSGLGAMRVLLGKSDVVVTSRAEAASLLAGESSEQAARSLAAEGPRVVVVTLGSQGALVVHNGEMSRVRAFEVREVVDTTGAGDAFAAGLIAGFLEGLEWRRAARLGCAVAAIKIRHLGARSGLPTRRQVDEFMRSGQGGVL